LEVQISQVTEMIHSPKIKEMSGSYNNIARTATIYPQSIKKDTYILETKMTGLNDKINPS